MVKGGRIATAVVVTACMAGLVGFVISGLGRWLVVVDSLKDATAVVVLGGGAPYRAIQAAQIFREGWAPEIWITRTPTEADEALVARLGLKFDFGDEASNRLVLQRLGVPPSAIRTLAPGARNTAEEVTTISAELARMGGNRVIIVTSKSHTRRVRTTWRAVVGSSQEVVVRYADLDHFDGTRWWERTNDALAVSREVFGLLNVWAGFPVRPDTSRAAMGDIEATSPRAGMPLPPAPARERTH